jgi:hypothetical protein
LQSRIVGLLDVAGEKGRPGCGHPSTNPLSHLKASDLRCFIVSDADMGCHFERIAGLVQNRPDARIETELRCNFGKQTAQHRVRVISPQQHDGGLP